MPPYDIKLTMDGDGFAYMVTDMASGLRVHGWSAGTKKEAKQEAVEHIMKVLKERGVM
jgi:hypothetical protein